MHILQVGWGLSPWAGGGYVEYLESLMNVLVQRGHSISYLCAGRYYKKFKKPTIKTWKWGAVRVYEIFNSPLIQKNGAQLFVPFGFDLHNESIENLVRNILNHVMPDIIHVQHLLGFPSSILEVMKSEFCLPTFITLHDYYAVCSRITLFDHEYKNCHDMDISKKCRTCLASERPLIYPKVVRSTFEIKHYGIYCFLHFLKQAWKKRFSLKQPKRIAVAETSNQYVEPGINFQERRNINVKRLSLADKILVPSQSAADVIKSFLKETGNIQVVAPVLKHFDRIRPQLKKKVCRPLHFIVLNGCSSISKGAGIICEAMELLKKQRRENDFKLHIFGKILPESEKQMLAHENVIHYGYYHINQLNQILHGMDVGIVPSVWNEVYGIVGLEMLAKGIPVISSRVGGAAHYLRAGVTGWINETNSACELVMIMQKIIEAPEQVLELNRKIIEQRSVLISDMREHGKLMEELYHQMV